MRYQLGKLPLPEKPETIITSQAGLHSIVILPLELPKLPPLHNDPFDRLLICQARARTMTIVTPDPLIQKYTVTCMW